MLGNIIQKKTIVLGILKSKKITGILKYKYLKDKNSYIELDILKLLILTFCCS